MAMPAHAYVDPSVQISQDGNYSVCILVEVGNFKALFTGDLNDRHGDEKFLCENNPGLLNEGGIDYYKMSAHGSNDATSEHILGLLARECIVVANTICGTDLTGVTSGQTRFMSEEKSREVLAVTSRVYPTLCSERSGYQMLYGTICTSITSTIGSAQEVHVTWQNKQATEKSFEEWLDSAA